MPILNETKAALIKRACERDFDDPEARGARAIMAMQTAFPEAMVEDFELIVSAQFGLPDPDDEHVIAAAVKTQAQALVTENLKDLPADILGKLNIEARTADDFIADTIALDEGRAIAAIRKMRERLKRPEMSPEEFLRAMEANGLLEQLRSSLPTSAQSEGSLPTSPTLPGHSSAYLRSSRAGQQLSLAVCGSWAGRRCAVGLNSWQLTRGRRILAPHRNGEPINVRSPCPLPEPRRLLHRPQGI
ncbi:PIN domain-containing protein [Novosphingobium mathurense]|uniref:PIN domain-containing protein n=1 Tax=Novosphingobium mathurense TaxID=428990 RepID=UPI001FE4F96D|nr:PIN domain-containing protein [Novosphingobium mathurense]